jgi:Arc/MetJ-type ribon-helix-helix transcriptional regulator
VGSINVTVRFSEEELRRLDELAQRMGRTRSDVIRDLITKFDEALRQEVERESKKWLAMGFVSALESEILNPELILRFVRRNVDILGFPDFLIGMVRVRNRIVAFSHHDRVGHQLLQLVKDRVEEEVRREEMEIEQEDDGGEEVGEGRAARARTTASRPGRSNTIRVAPVATKYRIMISNRSGAHIPRLTAVATAGKPASNGGGSGAKAAGAVSVSKNQKSGSAGIPTSTAPADSQPKGSNPQTNAGGSNPNPAGPVGQVSMDRPVGDFAFALVANLYHKRRESLLRLIEGMAGD